MFLNEIWKLNNIDMIVIFPFGELKSVSPEIWVVPVAKLARKYLKLIEDAD